MCLYNICFYHISDHFPFFHFGAATCGKSLTELDKWKSVECCALCVVRLGFALTLEQHFFSKLLSFSYVLLGDTIYFFCCTKEN